MIDRDRLGEPMAGAGCRGELFSEKHREALKAACAEDPLVHRHAADAERILEALVGAGAVAVEGYREGVDAKLGHGRPPS